MDEFTIKCASSATCLRLWGREGDYFHAELENPVFQGEIRIYQFAENQSDLARLFEWVAMNWQGWKGKHEWSSIEGDLSIGATMDSLGHVFMTVEFNSHNTASPFFMRTIINLEAGQLEGLAKDAKRFFGSSD